MTKMDSLPLDGTLVDGLKAYGSRLRIFLEVVLYSGGTLALVAYTLFVHTKRERVLYFLFLALAFLIYHGLPTFVRRVTQWLGGTAPSASKELDPVRFVADVTIAYEILQESVLARRQPEAVDQIQETVRELVNQFPNQVRIEKKYSVVNDGTLLVLHERLKNGDEPITSWFTTLVKIQSGSLDEDSSLRLVERISSLGVLLHPDKTTITRVPGQPELFPG